MVAVRTSKRGWDIGMASGEQERKEEMGKEYGVGIITRQAISSPITK
jgi:hypothetical protein